MGIHRPFTASRASIANKFRSTICRTTNGSFDKTSRPCGKVLSMNAINVIAPYKVHGMWVFDDPRVGLVQEPFVAGADTMIDRVVADIPDAERGFTLIFSTTPFPGHQYRLDWKR